MPKSVYIHIPFCEHICPYCDFNKVVLKGQPVLDYLHALRKEMEITFEREPAADIQTIYVGGGTPTALDTKQMRFFLDSVRSVVQPQTDEVEFSMEVNPGTVDEEKLRVMKEGGVNRLSFGVQSFDDQLLKRIGRIHDARDVYRSLALARRAGFENISIDLMFGLPEQTLPSLSRTVDAALELELPHLSAYSLLVEEGTPFHRLYQKGKLPLPSEEEEYEMYELVIHKMLDQGYSHYEISNFAKPGFESRHNLTYWRNEEYYGFGAGAHGYVRGVRYENAASLREYIDLVNKEGHASVHRHVVSEKEAMEETMMMGLRLKEGVSREVFRQRFGLALEDVYARELEMLFNKGLLQEKGGRYALTSKGVFLGNEVFVMFMQS